MPAQLTVLREKGKIWSHVRKKWLDETPEETVRQEYFGVLVNQYGFSLDQIDEEREVTGRGSGMPTRTSSYGALLKISPTP
jgi:type I restriction enzyme M protein